MLMRLGDKDKRIAFRLSTEQYYSIYRIYENYQKSCPNLTFSDFIRNIILSITANVYEQVEKNEVKKEC